MAWRMRGGEEYRSNFWKGLAISCRYGHIGLSDAVGMSVRDANSFNCAILDLVGEENRMPGHNDS